MVSVGVSTAINIHLLKINEFNFHICLSILNSVFSRNSVWLKFRIPVGGKCVEVGLSGKCVVGTGRGRVVGCVVDVVGGGLEVGGLFG